MTDTRDHVASAAGDLLRERGQGRKDDLQKPRYELLPWDVVACVVAVLTKGAVKYADDNWKRVPQARSRYFGAAMRHLTAWWEGELRDPETGEPHLAHAICCLVFLLWFDLNATVVKEPIGCDPAFHRPGPDGECR